MRGTARVRLRLFSQPRFIPGACGERWRPEVLRAVTIGSSPRVRGTAPTEPRDPLLDRFIPARAGNGAVFNVVHLGPPVHPRACGERDAASPSTTTETGSSPRVRGTDIGPDDLGCNQRFIPARAGNGAFRGPSGDQVAVHPRACGERYSQFGALITHCGSSPRVRGTVVNVGLWGKCNRFIPARAENGWNLAASTS